MLGIQKTDRVWTRADCPQNHQKKHNVWRADQSPSQPQLVLLAQALVERGAPASPQRFIWLQSTTSRRCRAGPQLLVRHPRPSKSLMDSNIPCAVFFEFICKNQRNMKLGQSLCGKLLSMAQVIET